MTISSALHSAMSGLTAASRASEIVSQNIANVMTDGYARRSLLLGANANAGPGVQILGIRRHADPVVISNRRSADAENALASVLADFHTRFQKLVGTTDDPGSISSRLANFESSLISAASRPDSTLRLDTAAAAARDLAGTIRGAAEGLRALRSASDRSIAQQVQKLNQSLKDVHDLNIRITAVKSSGGEVAALLDQRQVLVDRINEILPVRPIDRDNGQVALYSTAGVILIDGQPGEFGFVAANETMPHMTIDNGLLSGLTLNGLPLRTSGSNSQVSGGTMAAQFLIRDGLAVEAQADLDAVARDLVERFETPGLDATLAPGAPGLFTDNGVSLDISAEIGLAGRIELNGQGDPTAGGESWRLRDGLGAAGPGEVGDARLLQGLSGALSVSKPVASGSFGAGKMTAFDLGAAHVSSVELNKLQSQQHLSFASAIKSELTHAELSQGVDTDAELQSLMVIEKAFAANAKVIEAVDEMIQSILRL